MRIYTRGGDLAFKTFTFPDGQSHFKLETIDDSGFNKVTIETALKTPSDLFMVGLVADVLRANGFTTLNLDIRYLLGARMDRAISPFEPFTLNLVARAINSCGFTKVRLLDVHSEVATRLIRNSVNVLPFKVVEQVWSTIGPHLAVCPDKGAMPRIRGLLQGGMPAIIGEKDRELSTGKLLGFRIVEGLDYLATPIWQDRPFLIIDDICDGGGTFVGLAKELRKAGAKKVFLYVTHGIFSKPLPLEGIDHIYTTDSFGWDNSPLPSLTIIPISMEKL